MCITEIDNCNNYLYEDVYYTYNGRIIYDVSDIPVDADLQKHKRLRGGKGGFGSMLRAIGSQIEKTTNHEMCRDLSGRRMRDVNTEKKLKDWYDKASERERDKMRLYYEKRLKRREILERGPLPGHKFTDKEYDRQKRKIAHDLRGALDHVFENIVKDKPTQGACSSGEVSAKRSRLWIEKFDNDLFGGISDSSTTCASSNEDTQLELHNFDELISEKPVVINSDIGNKSDNIPLDFNSIEKVDTVEINIPDQTQSEAVSATPTHDPLSDDQLKCVQHAEELEHFGLEVLKVSLSVRGLKCGGTLSERAARLFSIKNLLPNEYPAKLIVKCRASK